MLAFQKQYAVGEQTRVLDIGGYVFNWSLLPEQPRLTIVNLHLPGPEESSAGWVVADGCRLPFKDQSFEIVFCNSVIEHLYNRSSQEHLASEIQRVGRSYYVQTPNRWFPVEPHLLTPLIHYLPKSWQLRLLRNFTVWGLVARPSQRQCERFLQETMLLDYKTMRRLFPQARILRERFLFLTKALIASRR
jgi:hypothetical protein